MEGADAPWCIVSPEAWEALPLKQPLEFRSEPRPPSALWDVADEAFLELVRCRAFMRVTSVSPKEGHFTVRMKCLWSFRTKNSGEQAEITMRGVPGIRMPGLRVTVEESRIWKDLKFESSQLPSTNTLFWRGTSIFTMEGVKAFDLLNFPFDRHILNLERLEFVWRSDKDAADFYKSIKVVEFTTETSSMLPEWTTYPAVVVVRHLLDPKIHRTISNVQWLKIPSYASKFSVLLRIERRDRFYSWQVFVVTYLITMMSLLPLGLPPNPNLLGDRLAMYATGVLTLVAYKRGISEHLPNVPYQTFTDWFLLAAIVTVITAAAATLYPYRLECEVQLGTSCVGDFESTYETLDNVENVTGVLLFAAWTVTVFWAFFLKPRRRRNWETILRTDSGTDDAFGKAGHTTLSSGGQEGEEEEEQQQHDSPARRVSGDSEVTQDFRRIVRAREDTGSSNRLEWGSLPPPEWNAEHVAHFLRALRLGHCVERFRAGDAVAGGPVDGARLAALSEAGLVGLGLTQLQARKVARRLRELGAARASAGAS